MEAIITLFTWQTISKALIEAKVQFQFIAAAVLRTPPKKNNFKGILLFKTISLHGKLWKTAKVEGGGRNDSRILQAILKSILEMLY